jgi:hypothetical protein
MGILFLCLLALIVTIESLRRGMIVPVIISWLIVGAAVAIA